MPKQLVELDFILKRLGSFIAFPKSFLDKSECKLVLRIIDGRDRLLM